MQRDEPFGMVLIEAMSCGTPVVALSRGSVPELIENGVTGLVSTDPDRLPELIERVEHISPSTCRRTAVEKFDSDKMARGYEELYLRVAAPRMRSRSALVHADMEGTQDAKVAITPNPEVAPLG